jgi:chemotaxis protein methyltransferase WspC
MNRDSALSNQHSGLKCYSAIETFVRESTGINPDATPGMMNRAVERILADRKYNDPEELLLDLKASKKVFDSFLEQILVPETWFFRYPEAYHYLKRWARQQITNRKPLRILSVPCSTGEEPFSIVMALLDAGFNRQQFIVDAADISLIALKKAEAGLYTENSFRGTDLFYREKYFQEKDSVFQLLPAIRSSVNFFVWNVQEPPPSSLKRHYDVIFCRNLFIYFHSTAQKRMKNLLNDLLDAHGLLFTGHAESGLLLAPIFRSLPPARAFVQCKK